MTAALVIGAVILCAMLCVSWYGWTTLPPGARVPVHFGIRYSNFVPKPMGLVMYPAVGVVVYLFVTFIGHANSASRAPGRPLPYLGLLAAMVIILVTQIGAIRAARRRSGG